MVYHFYINPARIRPPAANAHHSQSCLQANINKQIKPAGTACHMTEFRYEIPHEITSIRSAPRSTIKHSPEPHHHHKSLTYTMLMPTPIEDMIIIVSASISNLWSITRSTAIYTRMPVSSQIPSTEITAPSTSKRL